MAAIFSVSLVSTLPVYYYGVNQIKHKHLDFFSRTDPYVLQEQLIKDGAYYIVTPEGTVTWDEEWESGDVKAVGVMLCYKWERTVFQIHMLNKL